MFDEYPDRLMIEMVVDRIQKKVTGEDGELEAEQFHGGMQPPPGHRPPPPPPPGQNDHLRELIGDFKQRNVPETLPSPPLQTLVVTGVRSPG